ncbi:hypothetical protein [Paraflavitalea pollutisoli]|uniref:hypothetical protein n=1 Tax=Paraflavitalea pollutisoli TaxID=3034143 RepID=UPI0023ED1668|nr:hypothetical protein [Paraflavitalea sp. H1-2-19X]
MAKKDNAPKILAVAIATIFLVAILAFLFTKSEYLNYEITGWEVVKSYGAGFWVWALVGLVGAAVAGYVAYANYTGAGTLGRKLRGNMWTTILLVAIALICLCGPWGRACTDKANGGVGIKTTSK